MPFLNPDTALFRIPYPRIHFEMGPRVGNKRRQRLTTSLPTSHGQTPAGPDSKQEWTTAYFHVTLRNSDSSELFLCPVQTPQTAPQTDVTVASISGVQYSVLFKHSSTLW